MAVSAVIAVVGLGYVGLPLAAAFGKTTVTIGYDLSIRKIDEIRAFRDSSGTVSDEALRAATHLSVTHRAADLAQADFIIVAVPTPIDSARKPDFGPLVSASETIGRNMKRGAIVHSKKR